MKTYSAKAGEVEKKWYLVDAKDKVLGRLATEIARKLRGKDKPVFTPHMDTGDHVIVINAEKIKLTGNKLKQKLYHSYSGYVGGLKSITAEKLLEKKPENLLIFAVRGMLPKNKLRQIMLKKLKVYAGSEHPHTAQMPEDLNI